MSNIARVAGQAANTLSKPLDITDVFSTYLYEGEGGTQTITNGLDLAGEGGLVWIKSRSSSSDHFLFDTERGPQKRLITNATLGEYDLSSSGGLSAFNADGFNIGSYAGINSSAVDYTSWTFRKAPKFFDVVTYTGKNSAQTISHNLGVKPGFYLVKQTSGSGGSWYGYHSGLDSTYTNPSGMVLNSTNAAFQANSSLWNLTFPTSTGFTVGTSTGVNAPDATYVAYLFADNDGDGGFGDGSQDIIKCGSYTGNGSPNGPEIDLGFEPQWLLVKNASINSNANWYLLDCMRGWDVEGSGTGTINLKANTSDFEQAMGMIEPTSTGFKVNTTGSFINGSGNTIIYMAIRRGPLAVPEDATKVFAISQQLGTSGSTPSYNSGFPVDMAMNRFTTGTDAGLSDRLRGAKGLQTSGNFGEYANYVKTFDYMDGYYSPGAGAYSNRLSWMWKRAPSYFDVVAYIGKNSAQTISHNLGVAPEMMWVKRRDANDVWAVYSEDVGNTGFLRLNQINAITTTIQSWNNTSPTSSDFTLGDWAAVNTNNSTYIAYLFASVAEVSKISSYTGNGSSQTIDCGFTSGARFILIKRTDATGDWYFWDTERGIVAGNSPHLSLNTTVPQVTTDDSVDPASSGFIVNQVSATNINVSSAEYIFYAIA